MAYIHEGLRSSLFLSGKSRKETDCFVCLDMISNKIFYFLAGGGGGWKSEFTLEVDGSIEEFLDHCRPPRNSDEIVFLWNKEICLQLVTLTSGNICYCHDAEN